MKTFETILILYIQKAENMMRIFDVVDMSILILYKIIVYIFDEMQKYQKTKRFQKIMTERVENIYDTNHFFYINAIDGLFFSHQVFEKHDETK